MRSIDANFSTTGRQKRRDGDESQTERIPSRLAYESGALPVGVTP
jgi:hypothetical protein